MTEPDAGGSSSTKRVDSTTPARIVVVGAGFTGYYAARKLSRKLKPDKAHVTLVADTDGLLYQPLLPEVAAGALDPRTIVVPLVSTLKRVHLVLGSAAGVDRKQRTVSVIDRAGRSRLVPYDRLVLAPGGVTRIFDIPGLAEHALGFKTVAEALYLRDLVLGRMERANDEPYSERRRRLLSFVVVGAGYAGTELVAQLSRMTQRLLPKFPRVAEGDSRWLLLDMAPTIMPELGAHLGQHALQVLRERGVDVRLKTSVQSITDAATTLTDGTRVDGATVIWCAGVAPNPLIATLGLPTAKGRLVVQPDLHVPDHPEIYAAGDAAAVPDLAGQPASDGTLPLCPPTAQHAMRQGQALARNVLADLDERPGRDYRHRDLGLVVDLGGPQAVARPLRIALRGRPAKLVTRAYHVLALPTTKRRARALLDWLLAGSTPDDVAFGLPRLQSALASTEHRLSTGDHDSTSDSD